MKKIALSLIAAGLMAAGSAQAATVNLVNHAPAAGMPSGFGMFSIVGSTHTLNYAGGGDVTFALDAASSTPGSYTFAITGGPSFTLATSGALSKVVNLVAGSYNISVSSSVANAIVGASVSAVPLPGAAVLFGSALLGAGALRRKKAEQAAAVAA